MGIKHISISIIINFSKLTDFKDSVLPLLTKCRPNDEDLDIDEKRINLQEQFNAEIEAEMVNKHQEYKKQEKQKRAAKRVGHKQRRKSLGDNKTVS